MQRLFKTLILLSMVLALSSTALATNGDNLMAIGPISRAMGGVGIAAPQDAISAVFANPAAMCFGPYCPSSEINFAATAFMPHVDAKVSTGAFAIPGGPTFPAQTFQADSHSKVYPIPAIGLSVPITSGQPFWRFGLAAYGVSGLGVDYKGTALDQPQFFRDPQRGNFPLIAGEYTELSIMKFAPCVAFQPTEQLSFGAAFHVNYGDLDLRDGSSTNFGFGGQVGMIFKPTDQISLGLNYTVPQNITHERVKDFNGDRTLDSLKLESPQQLGIGIAYKTLDNKLLVELDAKWINWSWANGYQTFDWEDQYVLALGVQYKPMNKLTLRAGYNFGNNPVNTHNDFVGTGLSTVQGKKLPTYYYETFRVIGFPAVVEHHATAGIGYDFSPRASMTLGYTHAFENTIRERGTNLIGQPVTLQSSLSEDSVDFSFTWRF